MTNDGVFGFNCFFSGSTQLKPYLLFPDIVLKSGRVIIA
jgi:hypothetical protein